MMLQGSGSKTWQPLPVVLLLFDLFLGGRRSWLNALIFDNCNNTWKTKFNVQVFLLCFYLISNVVPLTSLTLSSFNQIPLTVTRIIVWWDSGCCYCVRYPYYRYYVQKIKLKPTLTKSASAYNVFWNWFLGLHLTATLPSFSWNLT